MRDSILVVVLFGVMVGGFYTLQQIRNQNHSQALVTKPIVSKSQVASSVQILKSKGERSNESSNHRSRKQVRHPRPSKAIAIKAREDDSSLEGLSSIYEGEGSGRSESREQRKQSAALTANDSESDLKSPESSPVIAGVPVAAWVQANRNRLAGAEITPEESGQLQVYLWCMEVKGGAPRYAGEKKCKDIVMAQGQSRRPSPQNFY